MKNNIQIEQIIPLDSEIAIKWSDGTEKYIKNIRLRDNCPCANCSGEKDIFGNIYIGKKKKLNEISYQISKITKIGHYAIRIYWMDNHSEGLYTFELIKKL